MKYNPNRNSRKRQILNLIARRLTYRYRYGLPTEVQTEKNPRNPFKFTIFRPDGEIVSLNPVPLDSDIRGGRSDVVAYAGSLPIKALTHLYLQ